MADHYPAEIHIGGPIKRIVIDELVKQIIATGASLNGYCENSVTDESAREPLKEGSIIDLFDDRARYGRFDELEKFLVRHRIHFDLHCDAYSEYDGENVYYRGGKKVLSLPAGQEGNILIRHEDIMNILNNNDLDDHGKLGALIKLIVPPETKPLEPIRFR